MTKKQEEKELFKERKMKEVADELEKYFKKLADEAALCKNEAKRALDRFAECGEMEFHINGEKLEIDKFLRTLNKILCFDIPSLNIRAIFTLPSSRVVGLVEKISVLRNHLFSIPGARFYNETPDILKKIKAETYVKIIK